ncbi:MAG: glucose-6-phosphate dehydrogenase [Micromonosporaceae bacterium]|nr:glucose-6-phosphate dehydrogenase [Micromonosporaceae bacterium]
MVALWDTTGAEVVRRLAAERRTAGGVTSGLALTLIAITDEKRVAEAEAAATIAAQQHPTRLLIAVRRNELDERSRLDAEVVVGGRLGPCEAVVMRMHGRLALHAESVALPLLAPDVPVVTWWHGQPPERIASDPLGVVAERRITDSATCEDPIAALRQRGADYAPGDTDLAWTRVTPWRTLVAGVFDTAAAPASEIRIAAPAADPGAMLLAGWLKARLGLAPAVTGEGNRLTGVDIGFGDGSRTSITAAEGAATLRRTGYPDRALPLLDRALGEELAEELRRLDPDQPYAEALGAAAGLDGLSERQARREHVWHDPALAERPEPAEGPAGSGAAG